MHEPPSFVETVADESGVLCYVIHAEPDPDRTTFITPDEASLQVGFVVYPEGGQIAPHKHRPLERHLVGTAEVLVVRAGRCEVDLYSRDGRLITTKTLEVNDILLLTGEGGHGFRMLEDTVLLEVKQGPYLVADEKEAL